MKILFFLGFPNPFPGAGWTRIGFFAKDWSEKGYFVEVLGTFSYTALQKKGVRRSGKVDIFNLIFHMDLGHPLVFTLNSVISFIVSTFFLLAKRPDIAVVSVPTGDAGLGALMACKLLKVKFVVDYRDEWEDYAITLAKSKAAKEFYHAVKKFTKFIYAKAKLIATVTPGTMKALLKRGLGDVKLITNGADTTIFRPLNGEKRNGNFTIFFSGRIGGYYRLDIMIKAFKKLVVKGLRDIRLVIAGAGEIKNLLNLARELGVLGNIKYVGSISGKAELAKLIAMSDVGIIPYDDNPIWKNSIPAKFYEYCACGIPVIATTHSDSLLADIIGKNRIGVTSPPLDVEKLAEAIFWLYKNRSFREEAGKRARKLIEEKFDRNKIAEEFLKLIEALI